MIRLAANDAASPFKALRANNFTFAGGMIAPAGNDALAIPIGDFVRSLERDHIEVTCDTWPETVPARGPAGSDRDAQNAPPGFQASPFSAHSWCAQFVEVGVDEDFGTVRVRRMVGAFDCGRIYNPTLAESQWKGGMIMGLGQALLEGLVVDRRYGRIVNDNLAESVFPVNADIPDIEVFRSASRISRPARWAGRR